MTHRLNTPISGTDVTTSSFLSHPGFPRRGGRLLKRTPTTFLQPASLHILCAGHVQASSYPAHWVDSSRHASCPMHWLDIPNMSHVTTHRLHSSRHVRCLYRLHSSRLVRCLYRLHSSRLVRCLYRLHSSRHVRCPMHWLDSPTNTCKDTQNLTCST
jgi:hypothetical protein